MINRLGERGRRWMLFLVGGGLNTALTWGGGKPAARTSHALSGRLPCGLRHRHRVLIRLQRAIRLPRPPIVARGDDVPVGLDRAIRDGGIAASRFRGIPRATQGLCTAYRHCGHDSGDVRHEQAGAGMDPAYAAGKGRSRLTIRWRLAAMYRISPSHPERAEASATANRRPTARAY